MTSISFTRPEARAPETQRRTGAAAGDGYATIGRRGAVVAALAGTFWLAAQGPAAERFASAVVGAAHAQTPEPIVLGVLAGLTGGSRTIGVPYLDAVKFAADEINAAGGINGRLIELVVEDNETKPVEGVQAALKLVSADQVDAILCSCFTIILFPIMEAFKDTETVVMNNASTTPAVRDLPGKLVSPMGTDDILGKDLAEFAHGLGYTEAGIFTVNDPYGTAFHEIVKKTFTGLGGTVPVEIVVDANLPDYRPELTRILNAGVDAVFFGTYTNDMRLQFRQATQLGWKGVAFKLYPSVTELKLDQEANDRFYGVEPTWLANDPEGEKWAEKLRAAIGTDPGFWHATGYDALYLAAHGVANAADMSGDAIREAIREYTKSYSGPTGPIELDDRYVRVNPRLAHFKQVDGDYARMPETE